ncbi:MAG: hypothetical protein Q9216_007059, partial [Gyalolechia sp. 2 TL-2023]
GISLPLPQYSTLLTLLPEIEAALMRKGQKVPRPDFRDTKVAEDDVVDDVDGESDDAGNDNEEEEVGVGVEGKKEKEKKRKKKENFEATSEEEED